MPYTFAQLKTAVLADAFPDGEARSLKPLHKKIIVEALIDLQQWIPQLQVNNTWIIPFCGTYFQCGFSVFHAPRGKINRVSTYVRLDGSCNEDSTEPVNWCSEVQYSRVPYLALEKHLDKTLRCRCGCGLLSMLNIPLLQCKKTLASAYPAPDDAAYACFPELPLGFHYPSDATDLRYRATVGAWALQHNRIYLAPWINSSEIVLIEWDGIKRDWQDSDVVEVEFDPLLNKAVRHYLLMHHFGELERDGEAFAYHKLQYEGAPGNGTIGAREALIHAYNEETRPAKRCDSHSRRSNETLIGQSTGIIECSTTTTTTTSTTSTTCALPDVPDAFNFQLPILSWTPGTGDVQAWRSVDGADYVLLATVDSGDGQYSDDTWVDFPAGTVLYYKVRGSNSCGTSAFTDPQGGVLE